MIEGELQQRGIRVKIDMDTTKRPGFKFAEHELTGTPVRLGLGLRDIEKGVVEVARRDTKEKQSVALSDITEHVVNLLEEIQNSLLERARSFRDEHITDVDDFETFKSVLDEKGGFVRAFWDGTTETELKIKEATKATIRCIPLEVEEVQGKCVFSGQPSSQRVLFAKAY